MSDNGRPKKNTSADVCVLRMGRARRSAAAVGADAGELLLRCGFQCATAAAAGGYW